MATAAEAMDVAAAAELANATGKFTAYPPGHPLAAPIAEAAAPVSAEEAVARAEKLKAEGNAFFKAGGLAAAREKYEGLLNVIPEKKHEAKAGVEPDAAGPGRQLRLSALLNLALCLLKAEPAENERALMCCEEALDLDPESAKAMYRKGKALTALGELKEAEWELKRAARASPKDAGIRKDLADVQQKLKDIKEQEKKAFSGGFEKIKGFGDGADRPPTVEPKPLFPPDFGKKATSAPSRPIPHAETEAYPFWGGHDASPGGGNVFKDVADPVAEAKVRLADGRLEEAVWCWEVAVKRALRDSDNQALATGWFKLAQLFTDLGIDRGALQCTGKIPPLPRGCPFSIWQTTRLLRAACLLNDEAGASVGDALEDWLVCVVPGYQKNEWVEDEPLAARLDTWRLQGRTRPDVAPPASLADANAACGLLALAEGRGDEALQHFANAAAAPEDPEHNSLLGDPQRRSTKWNMLGAVLANRGHPEQALVAYAQALTYQPHYPRAYTNRGIALTNLERHIEAVGAFAAALGLSPAWASEEPWLLAARSARSSGDEALAEVAEAKNLTKLAELLASAGKGQPPVEAPKPDAEVLAAVGFPFA